MTQKSRKHPPNDSDTYRPGSFTLLCPHITLTNLDISLSKEEKARKHRKAQKAYYASLGIDSNPMARAKHRVRVAASRKKALARLRDEQYVPCRLSTPSWGNLELPPRSEMRTEPAADRHTMYSAVARQSTAVGERIAIDALVTLRQPQHIGEEWPRPPSDSILERAMLLTSSSLASAPASLRPAAGNAVDAGAGNAGVAVREALERVARVNKDHPLALRWPNNLHRDYYRTFWTRDDHRLFLGRFLSLETYVAVRRWRLHVYNCMTYDASGQPLESYGTFHSRWPTGVAANEIILTEQRPEWPMCAYRSWVAFPGALPDWSSLKQKEFWSIVVATWIHDWESLKAEQGEGGNGVEQQKDWLEARLPRYLDAKTTGDQTDFFVSLDEGWFKKWPEEEAAKLPAVESSIALAPEEHSVGPRGANYAT
ncbi:hypothetical protein C8F04DRAFT_1186438 [Mycena alexandri]|uniref:Uncharacterized protein n=1 Tax=Mycena alexandri TaxID=1745969 RepID=A0AAD6SP25_9AGAR|nr:hypothetical protein C8F04DRAFT_1186438 [Mycena alexandri]